MKLAQSAFIAATFALSLPAIAEEHRELGPHEHGVGRLNIAIEGKRVSMELEVPGADIVGFEHEASTAAQKAAVKKAKNALEGALNVFKLPTEAKCKLAKATVKFQAEDEHEHEHKNADSKADDQAEAAHEGEGEEGHHHSEFHAEYAIDCAAPEKLTGIDFKYFDLFVGARKLDINLATEKGQSHYEVARERPQLKFGEIG
jgi:hypothetical protein